MLHLIVSSLDSFVSAVQTLLYVNVVQPLLFRFNLMGYDEDTFDAQIVQEGSHSPADLFYTENTPALEYLQQRGLLAKVDASTLADGPAAKAGIEEGSRIASINGVDVRGHRTDDDDDYVFRTSNVSRLALKWSFELPGSDSAREETPLVVDGVMYFNSCSKLFAVDASTGQPVYGVNTKVLKLDLPTMARTVIQAAAVAFVASLVVAVVDPGAGLDPEGRLRGVFAHKNVLGQVMAAGVLASLHGMRVSGRRRSCVSPGRWPCWTSRATTRWCAMSTPPSSATTTWPRCDTMQLKLRSWLRPSQSFSECSKKPVLAPI